MRAWDNLHQATACVPIGQCMPRRATKADTETAGSAKRLPYPGVIFRNPVTDHEAGRLNTSRNQSVVLGVVQLRRLSPSVARRQFRQRMQRSACHIVKYETRCCCDQNTLRPVSDAVENLTCWDARFSRSSVNLAHGFDAIDFVTDVNNGCSHRPFIPCF